MMMTVKPDIRFYDTCSLLIAGESAFVGEPFAVSSITFKELEHIKISSNKDPDVKYSARLLLHLFEKYPQQYSVIVHCTDYEKWILDRGFEVSDDLKILSDAIHFDETHPDEVVFVSNDLSLRTIANLYFGDGMIEKVNEDELDHFKGYREIIANNDMLNEFYQDTT